MPQPTGGKVNASNLNVEGLDEVATPLLTDNLMLGRDGEQNTKVPLSAVSAIIPDPLLISAGTVNDPGLGFIGDTDTGLFSPGADEIGITAGGVEIARFTELAGVAQLILPFQNNPATPSLAFGDGDTGIRESADDTLQITIGGLSHTLISSQWIFRAILSNGPGMLAVDSTATVPNVLPNRDDLNTGLGTNGVDVMSLIAGGQQCIEIAENAAAPEVGFYGTTAIPLQVGVAVTAAAIHAALVALGLITA